MSKITLTPNASGAGTFTIQSPATDTNRTFTLPDKDGELSVGGGGFTYAAVTGATQDLDLDNGNFFDAGSLTADTTLTFSNVPTEARWTYTFEQTFESSNPWDVSYASEVRNFSVTTEETAPSDVFFKPDGTKMYVLGTTSDSVNEYDLRAAWNVSTASHVQTFSVATNETSPKGLFFKPDGLKMYVTGSSGDDVNEYHLSTAWDISTASYDSVFSVSSQATNPHGIFFKPDGLKMYIIGSINLNVNEYSLSAAWDVSTSSYVRNFSISTNSQQPTGVFFKPDGTKMYVTSNFIGGVNEYNLSTAWNVSTASYSQGFAASDTGLGNAFFKPDGLKMFLSTNSGDRVKEYSIGSAFTVTVPLSVRNPPLSVAKVENQVTYDFFTADSGTTVTLIGETIL